MIAGGRAGFYAPPPTGFTADSATRLKVPILEGTRESHLHGRNGSLPIALRAGNTHHGQRKPPFPSPGVVRDQRGPNPLGSLPAQLLLISRRLAQENFLGG